LLTLIIVFAVVVVLFAVVRHDAIFRGSRDQPRAIFAPFPFSLSTSRRKCS
jgi:hypothetical protein